LAYNEDEFDVDEVLQMATIKSEEEDGDQWYVDTFSCHRGALKDHPHLD